MPGKISLAGNSGHVRNLDPEHIEEIDVSAATWICPEQGGAYLFIDVGGDLSLKLIGDDAFHTLVVPNSYECRMAVKSIETGVTTCTGIHALY